MREKKSTKGQKCSRVGRGAVLKSGREGLSDEVTFEQEQGVEMSPVGIWEKRLLGREDSKAKGLETNGSNKPQGSYVDLNLPGYPDFSINMNY